MLARPAEMPNDNSQQRASIERAMDAIRKQHTWGDITDEDYQAQRQELKRTLADVPREQTAPFALTDYSRSATILSEFGTLWSHPGVSDARRKEFIEEVFEQVQIDELGIRAVQPADEYLPLTAIARWGEIASDTPVSRSRPLTTVARGGDLRFEISRWGCSNGTCEEGRGGLPLYT